ncbi:hypothetical protein C7121_04625 [Paenibacillus glucanolyticus]|jgi:hypothetical protein|uniref:Uncharacterized protein n=1 Tax=Paenibacillus glucanolyticus TaxID=59843 RepID=A0A163JAC7_9BACL|nr:hypothetical protein A3958_10890 [Paenibacillus glucanolyticus]AVV55483.1 hypothetical protein C7121_04625 [Paenibacillus glucanolyticus]KZS46469.1 hypothetical protein AWU65_11355 [Paenibacillus glucanolyticus]
MNLTLKLQISLKRKYDAKNDKPYNITLSKILIEIFLMKNRLIRNDNIEKRIKKLGKNMKTINISVNKGKSLSTYLGQKTIIPIIDTNEVRNIQSFNRPFNHKHLLLETITR